MYLLFENGVLCLELCLLLNCAAYTECGRNKRFRPNHCHFYQLFTWIQICSISRHIFSQSGGEHNCYIIAVSLASNHVAYLSWIFASCQRFVTVYILLFSNICVNDKGKKQQANRQKKQPKSHVRTFSLMKCSITPQISDIHLI